MSLKKQAISGMVWTFSQQFGTQLITFLVGLILARLLLPEDFGTIALFTVLISISLTLVDSGMSSSIIRSKDLDERDFSTIFWFNLVVSIAIYAIMFAVAPLVAKFFNVEILTRLIRCYSVVVIINALSSIQSTILVKEMNFKKLFSIQLPSILISGIAAILMAYYGFGIWTLVFYPILQSILSCIQFWLYSNWRPSFVFDKSKFFYHFNFGYKMTLSGLIDTIFKNLYTIIIGKLFSPQQLGYYYRADTLKQLPVSNLSTALNKVTFPLFAKISHDNVQLKVVYRKLMKLVIFLIAPLLTLMIVSAEPMIRFLLTEKWLPAVPYFQVLALAGILYPIHSYNLNILKVKGRSDLFLKLEIIKKLLVIIVLSITFQFGIMAIIWGQVFNSCVAFFINTYYTGKILKYGSISQIKDLLPTLILAGFIGLLIHLIDVNYMIKLNDFVRLVVITLLFASSYLISTKLLKFQEIKYLKELLKK